jgi:hypothetical protein
MIPGKWSRECRPREFSLYNQGGRGENIVSSDRRGRIATALSKGEADYSDNRSFFRWHILATYPSERETTLL